MKSILLLTAVLVLSCVSFSQQLSEKLIQTIEASLTPDISASAYDRTSGSFIIKARANDSPKYYFFTPAGMSPPFDKEFTSFKYVFDKEGGVYYAAAEEGGSGVAKIYLMKNEFIVKDYFDISQDCIVTDGVLYLRAYSAKNLMRILQLDLATSYMKQSAEYNSIDFAFDFQHSKLFEFTPGMRPVFVAEEESSNSLMYPGEGTYFDGRRIEPWLSVDKNGEYVFIASRSEGKDFIMQGEHDYELADKIYPPVVFDSENRPVYYSYNYITDQKSKSKVFAGSVQIGRTYSVISALQITPRGKIAYIGSIYGANGSTIDSSFVVVNGEQVKRFAEISSLKFTPEDVPVYTASVKPRGKFNVYSGGTKIDSSYAEVTKLELLPAGRVSYMAFTNETEFIFKIGASKFGPFNNYSAFTKGNVENYFQYDAAGNYVFASSYNAGLNSGDGRFIDTIFINDKPANVTLYNIKYLKLAWPHVISAGYTEDENGNSVVYDNSVLISSAYDKTADFQFDEKTNTLSFIGKKGNEIYYCEIKL